MKLNIVVVLSQILLCEKFSKSSKYTWYETPVMTLKNNSTLIKKG
jgi:hypothetical protein